MKVTARIWRIAGLICLMVGFSASAASGAEFGVTEEHFEAGTCTVPTCTYASLHEQFYTQASGHPPFGITGFEFNSEELLGVKIPVGKVRNIRVDVPPGLAANPDAIPRCPVAKFEKDECPESGAESTLIGINELTLFTGADVPVTANVFNLEQPEGIPLEFGIQVPVVNEHIFLVGHVSWSTDYHEYFEIHDINESVPLLKSKLIFVGNAGTGFLTLPSECSSTTTSHLRVESWEGAVSETDTHTPVGVEGCDEKVPFAPSIHVEPQTMQSDQPDAAHVRVELPQANLSAENDSSDLKDAVVTLPEEMTLNPAVAEGLVACSDAQIGIKTTNPVTCPPASKIGSVTIETPDLPEPLTGSAYVGEPRGSEAAAGQYRMFVDAESKYGVSVRLEGHIAASLTTGRLTTTFSQNPQLPFSNFILAFEGLHAPLANPLRCGAAATSATFVPYTGTPSVIAPSEFTVDSDGKGGACPSTLPFALSQASHSEPSTGGHTTSFTLSLARSDGNQYLGKTTTTLPPGLVAKVPNVQQCGEAEAKAAEANKGECPEASKIGVVLAAVGAGPNPLVLPGTVYFTGPYAGAPFGLLVSVPAEKVGPFNFGKIVTRATVNIDPYSARVVVGATLPTIVGGAPIRLKGLTVTVNRSDFTLNPTNCGVLAAESLLTSTFGSTQLVSSPFQASGCSGLGFNPTFSAKTNAKASRRNGASFEVSVGYPAGSQANIKSVFVQLPKQLPSRLSTLNKACPEATFKANPASCPAGSAVGVASATTPVLPGTLSGPAYFVSHGGASFPDLDVDLSGDGVKVILVGATNITTGITTSNFASIPDVPVSSFHLKLPAGPFSALAAHGNLCASPLIMPTTITAQNGAVIKQSTRIAVAGCKGTRAVARVRILSRRVRGHKVVLTLRVPSPGALTVGGRDLLTLHRRVGKARRLTLSVPLSRAGLRALARAHRHHHHLKLRVRVRFVPRKGHPSFASAVVRFR